MGLNCHLLWLPTVVQELENDNPELRYEAAAAAGALGEVEAVRPLIELLADPDAEVRLAAVTALGHIGGAEAKQALRQALHHKEQSMRDAAAGALAEIEHFDEPLSPQGLD
jgi:HEAT repeat protein